MKRLTIISFILFFCIVSLFANDVLALNLKNAFNNAANLPLGDVVDQTAYGNAGDAAPDLLSVVSSIINTFLSVLGVVFMALMIYGGYLWMTAMGDQSKTSKAKDLITGAVIGIIIVAAAYAISYFVTQAIVSKYVPGNVAPVVTTQPCNQTGCP